MALVPSDALVVVADGSASRLRGGVAVPRVDRRNPRGALWSLLHVPCVSFPVTRGPKGLPIGVQAIGAYGDDARVLAVAAFLARVAAQR